MRRVGDGAVLRADVLAALAAGVNGFVPKGLRDDDLVAALETILSGAIYVPSSLRLLRARTVNFALILQSDKGRGRRYGLKSPAVPAT